MKGVLIREIRIEPKTKIKIAKKHGVQFTEIKKALMDDPSSRYIQRIKNRTYILVHLGNRYLTVIFYFKDGIATILNAVKWLVLTCEPNTFVIFWTGNSTETFPFYVYAVRTKLYAGPTIDTFALLHLY